MHSQRPSGAASYWVRDFLKAGASFDEIFNIMLKWATLRGDLGSFQVAASAAVEFGSRKHVDTLAATQLGQSADAAAILADTTFAVARRSLV